MLAAETEFGSRKQPVNDVVILADAIIDQLAVAFGTDDEQRRRFALGDAARHLDVNFRAIVKGRKRPPGRIIAFDLVTEAQLCNVSSNIDQACGLCRAILAAQCNELVLRILLGHRGHIVFFS